MHFNTKLLLLSMICLAGVNYRAVDAQPPCIGVDCATQLRQNAADSNGGCPMDKVYTKVGCAQCQPGTSGWTSTAGTCALNDYCDDDGNCQPIRQSPFYGAICPFESGGTLSLWCGPGLRCYEHVCLICKPGMTDTDGKICVGGEWTYSKWAATSQDPPSTWLLLIFLTMLVITPLNVWHIWRYRRDQRNFRKLLKEVEQEEQQPLTEERGPYKPISPPQRSGSLTGSKMSKERRRGGGEDDDSSSKSKSESIHRPLDDPTIPSLYESSEEMISAVPLSRVAPKQESDQVQEALSTSEEK